MGQDAETLLWFYGITVLMNPHKLLIKVKGKMYYKLFV